jgi:hypothetical protein
MPCGLTTFQLEKNQSQSKSNLVQKIRMIFGTLSRGSAPKLYALVSKIMLVHACLFTEKCASQRTEIQWQKLNFSNIRSGRSTCCCLRVEYPVFEAFASSIPCMGVSGRRRRPLSVPTGGHRRPVWPKSASPTRTTSVCCCQALTARPPGAQPIRGQHR